MEALQLSRQVASRRWGLKAPPAKNTERNLKPYLDTDNLLCAYQQKMKPAGTSEVLVQNYYQTKFKFICVVN